jgi:homocysteine S-methyltransferase
MRAALDSTRQVGAVLDVSVSAEAVEEVAERAAPSELAQKLIGSAFVISVEMSPPKGLATEKVVQAAHMLREAGADTINVTDSPMARMRMSPWAVCHLLQNQGRIETVLHFPTRGRNLLRVQGDLLAAHALGVRNLFIVMGDPTNVGDYPDAADNYDIVPSGLVNLIKHNLNDGKDWAGNPIGQPTNFLAGCALNLVAPDIEREIKALRKKLDGGADFLITQPIFEAGHYTRFMEHYEKVAGPLRIPVLVGLMPLASLKHATFLRNEVPGIIIPDSAISRIEAAGENARQVGVEMAQELGEQLQSIARGLYMMPQFGRYDLIAEIIEGVRGK